jgi:peptidoglycan/LPS O-acetylase OafA/YrhL
VTAALAFAGSVVLAWVCLKFYDEPVRRWLARRFLEAKPAAASAPVGALRDL